MTIKLQSCLYNAFILPPVGCCSCWIQNDIAFYVTVVAFALLILICNISVFGVVLVQIRGMQLSKAAGQCSRMLHEMRVVASLTFLLGFTWILAFFAWGPVRVPLLYLFTLLNTLQGKKAAGSITKKVIIIFFFKFWLDLFH